MRRTADPTREFGNHVELQEDTLDRWMDYFAGLDVSAAPFRNPLHE